MFETCAPQLGQVLANGNLVVDGDRHPDGVYVHYRRHLLLAGWVLGRQHMCGVRDFVDVRHRRYRGNGAPTVSDAQFMDGIGTVVGGTGVEDFADATGGAPLALFQVPPTGDADAGKRWEGS